MENPYRNLPDTAFWRRAVAGLAWDVVDPVTGVQPRISRSDRVATAGSCFAQHLSRELLARGFDVMIEEGEPEDDGDRAACRAFSAAFGNIYTARQLLQLFQRAYGLFEPADIAWRRADGRYVDPFRPAIRNAGFASPAAVAAARLVHLDAVRRVFETCDWLVFTLGLTEGWVADGDGAAFPLSPGVDAAPETDAYHFHNMSFEEVVGDMRAFLGLLREVNPGVRVLLTVSPVPLIATYEPRHVLVSTTASKAILRAASDVLASSEAGLSYFPSYEIITGPQARGRYFEPDLRSVTEAGVAQVMELFSRHMLGECAAQAAKPAPAEVLADEETMARLRAFGAVICDEERLETKAAVR